MVVRNNKDLEGLLRIGQICGQALQHMLAHVQPGLTTRELDQIGADFLKKHNAQSAPITAYKFPGWTCISVNEEIAHGIPGDRKIMAGDIVNVDVSALLEGYWGDTGATMLVPPIKAENQRMCDYALEALWAGIRAARVNQPVYEIGRAIENVAKRGNYSIIRDLGGHGVGRGIHESPTVHNYYTRKDRQPLIEGLVITIEPFLNRGKGRIETAKDKWTIRTIDRTFSAQYEHTVIITGDEPIAVTKVN